MGARWSDCLYAQISEGEAWACTAKIVEKADKKNVMQKYKKTTTKQQKTTRTTAKILNYNKTTAIKITATKLRQQQPKLKVTTQQ